MTITKSKIIDAMFAEIAMPVFIYEIQPDQRGLVFDKLERMIQMWETKDIFVGYRIGGTESDESGIPPNRELAVISNLAMQCAGMFGKTVPNEVREIAKDSYNMLAIIASTPNEMQFPGTMPRGAGYKYWQSWNRPYVYPPDDDPLTNQPTDTDVEIR